MINKSVDDFCNQLFEEAKIKSEGTKDEEPAVVWGLIDSFLTDAKAYVSKKIKSSSIAPTGTSNCILNDKIICRIDEKLSLLAPRGKFDVEFGDKNIVFKGTKDLVLYVDYSNIAHLLKVPKKDRVNKHNVSQYVFVIQLMEPIPSRNSQLSTVAFQISATDMNERCFQLNNVKREQTLTKDVLHKVMDSVLEITTKKQIIRAFPERNDANIFRSTAGESFIPCFRKTSNGVLFFLPEGLFFMQPFIFIPRCEIVSIECGRGGVASLRTFDLTVELLNKSKVEFSMLEKEEFSPISAFVKYFAKLKEADEMKVSSSINGKICPQEKSDLAEDTDDESDEDYCSNRSSGISSDESEECSDQADCSDDDRNSDQIEVDNAQDDATESEESNCDIEDKQEIKDTPAEIKVDSNDDLERERKGNSAIANSSSNSDITPKKNRKTLDSWLTVCSSKRHKS